MAGLIDTDIHPQVNGMGPVLQHLPPLWRRRFQKHNLLASGFPYNRYNNAGFTTRADALPPGGGLAGSDPAFLSEDLLDRWGIESALMISLQAGSFAAWTDPVEAPVAVSAINDYFVEEWLPKDSRYRLGLAVTTHDAAVAAAEIAEHAANPQVAAVFLILTDVAMGSERIDPIYEAAVAAELPVVVHVTGAEGTYVGTAPYAVAPPRTYPELHTLNPELAWSHITSLVFAGTFQRHPRLRILFAEYGFSWLPSLMWRMDASWRTFRGEVPWLEKPPSRYVAEHLRFTTQPIDEPAESSQLDSIIEIIDGGSLLMFSSDYPHYDTDNPEVVTRHFPAGLRQRICRDNAIAWIPRMAG